MPPFMGQGLNSGMRDAFNLGWKLAYLRQGLSSARLLDTYSSERIPGARATVEQSVETGRLIDQLAGRSSHGVSESAGYGGSRRRVAYENGVVAGSSEHRGTIYSQWHRFTDYDAGSFLVLLAIDASVDGGSLSEWRIPHVVRRADRDLTYGADVVFVRPDGYVAAVCSAAECSDVMRTLDSAMR